MMVIENHSLPSTQLNNCWHWRWGRGGAQKGGCQKGGNFTLRFFFFALVYLLMMSKSKLMALDTDKWVWIEEKSREKCRNREGKGLWKPVVFIKCSLGKIIPLAILSKAKTVTIATQPNHPFPRRFNHWNQWAMLFEARCTQSCSEHVTLTFKCTYLKIKH